MIITNISKYPLPNFRCIYKKCIKLTTKKKKLTVASAVDGNLLTSNRLRTVSWGQNLLLYSHLLLCLRVFDFLVTVFNGYLIIGSFITSFSVFFFFCPFYQSTNIWATIFFRFLINISHQILNLFLLLENKIALHVALKKI